MVAVARTSNTMLNRSNSGHPWLVPDLEEKLLAFYQQDVYYGFVINNLYYVEMYTFITILMSFCHEWMFNFIE